MMYGQDPVTGYITPGFEDARNRPELQCKHTLGDMPQESYRHYQRLEQIWQNKFTKNTLKVCAFYNKSFELRHHGLHSNHMAPQFTRINQERADTGNGESINYLKQIVDYVTARMGGIRIDPLLSAEIPSVQYLVYKDEASRILRKFANNDEMSSMARSAFHDAAILGFSYAFLMPTTGKHVAATDYEVAVYEDELSHDLVQYMLYRNTNTPLTWIAAILPDMSPECMDYLQQRCVTEDSLEFTLFVDACAHKMYAVVDNYIVYVRDYEYPNVLVSTFRWDIGFSSGCTTSLFDTLYPIQREIDRIAAKIQQLIRLYKGPIPIFDSSVDLFANAVSNGTGEYYTVDSTRKTADLVTVVQPTPLDPTLTSAIDSRKTQMLELAGIQNMTFSSDSIKSAAAVIALDQLHDNVYEAQLQGLGQFMKQCFEHYVEYCCINTAGKEEWVAIKALLQNGYIDLKVVSAHDPLNSMAAATGEVVDDLKALLARLTIDVIAGRKTFDSIPPYVDRNELLLQVMAAALKFSSNGIELPGTIHLFFVDAFIDSVATGQVNLAIDTDIQ